MVLVRGTPPRLPRSRGPSAPATAPSTDSGLVPAAGLTGTPQAGLTPEAGLTGTPALPSAYLVDNGAALVFVGSESWTAVWASEGNGSQVYSNALLLIAYDLRSSDFLLKVDAYQGSHGWVSNQSVLMASLTETVITVNFVSDANWQSVTLDIGGPPSQGGAVWQGQIATPFSLLPPSVLNVGGLDILALGIISEGVACFAGMTGLARVLQRRARYAPKFSLLIWGHVVVVGIAATVILDYQWVNMTFAGWSPLAYAFAVSPMMFLHGALVVQPLLEGRVAPTSRPPARSHPLPPLAPPLCRASRWPRGPH